MLEPLAHVILKFWRHLLGGGPKKEATFGCLSIINLTLTQPRTRADTSLRADMISLDAHRISPRLSEVCQVMSLTILADSQEWGAFFDTLPCFWMQKRSP